MASNWAIVVGINHYEHLPKERHLRFAVQDAENMKAFLCKYAGFPFENILLCTDESQPIGYISTRPALTNLQRLLLEHIQQATEADNFWFFFAGHGMVGDDRQDYLLPRDGYPAYLERSAISITFVTECLRNCRAKNIVLILDMCRREGADASRDIGTEVGEQTIEIARQQGIITIFSCNRGQYSYEIPALQQGAFTYTLLQGLQRHTILRQLEAYLNREVPAINRKYGTRIQVPRIVAEPAGKYDLPLLPEHTTQPDVAVLTPTVSINEPQLSSPTTSLGHSKAKIFRRPFLKWLALFSSLPIFALLNRLFRPPSSSPVNPTPAPTYQSDIELSPVSVSPPEYTQPVETNTAGGRLLWNVKFQTVTVDERGDVISRHFEQAQFIKEDLGNGILLEMIKIPGGAFEMGSPPEEKGHRTDQATSQGSQRTVQVLPFFAGKFPVTQAQYKAVMGDNPSLSQGDNLPVLNVNWYNAVEFCERLSQKTKRTYRLPSEAEWEYMCRSKTTTPFCFGSTLTSGLANYNWTEVYRLEPKQLRSLGRVTEVGTFPPNAFGLYDVHGNVWEWCADPYHADYDGAPEDSRVWTSNTNDDVRVLRGGSLYDSPWDCTSAKRLWGNARSNQDDALSFRIVADLE